MNPDTTYRPVDQTRPTTHLPFAERLRPTDDDGPFPDYSRGTRHTLADLVAAGFTTRPSADLPATDPEHLPALDLSDLLRPALRLQAPDGTDRWYLVDQGELI